MSSAVIRPKEGKVMKSQESYVCPRCDYPLVPVHAVEGSRRRVIALSCPEPYCDHMQMIPRSMSAEVAREASKAAQGLRRAAH